MSYLLDLGLFFGLLNLVPSLLRLIGIQNDDHIQSAFIFLVEILLIHKTDSSNSSYFFYRTCHFFAQAHQVILLGVSMLFYERNKVKNILIKQLRT